VKSQRLKQWFALSVICLIMAGGIVYLNIPVFRGHVKQWVPLMLLSTSIVTVLCVLFLKRIITISYFELAFLALVVFRIINSLFHPGSDVEVFVAIVFILLLYLGFKTICEAFSIEYVNCIIQYSISLLILVYWITVLVIPTWENGITFLYTPNTSVFGILLAAQLAFLVGAQVAPSGSFLAKCAIFKPIGWAIIFIGVMLLVFSNGRAGWLGLIAAILFIFLLLIPSRRKKIQFLVLGFVVSISILLLLVRYKPASSAGRMVILKVSGQMAKYTYLTGIGEGNFKRAYNLAQGHYFGANGIDSDEALLADNTFYAFNDPFQFFIENGIIGTLILLLVVYFLWIEMNRKDRRFFPARCVIVSISVSSLFFYPFHVVPITVLFILCLALVNARMGDTTVVNIPKKASSGIRITFILIGIFIALHFYTVYRYFESSDQIYKLDLAGFKTESLEKYRELNHSYIRDNHTLYRYANKLYDLGQLSQCYVVLRNLKDNFPTSDVFILLGKCSDELMRFKEAESYFIQAITMVPNRMKSRYCLFEFYKNVNDSVNARHWANSILHMKVKRPSVLTKTMQDKVFSYLHMGN
jgi:tetratricopeptide (TPR) repeat protein